MHKKYKILSSLLVTLFLSSCAKNAILIQGGNLEAEQYSKMKNIFHIGEVEEFESGEKLFQYAHTGKNILGNYIAFRSVETPHCTKGWYGNSKFTSQTYLASSYAKGAIRFITESGVNIHCLYNWSNSQCSRVGACKSSDEKYYRVEF